MFLVVESYHTQLGFNDLFTGYEMELETHGHVQIRKQLGFHEHQISCYHYGWKVMTWN